MPRDLGVIPHQKPAEVNNATSSDSLNIFSDVTDNNIVKAKDNLGNILTLQDGEGNDVRFVAPAP